MIPSLWVIGNCFLENIQLIARKIKHFKSFQKNLKNSAVKPSLPGDLLFFMFFNTSRISLSDIFFSSSLEVCELLIINI